MHSVQKLDVFEDELMQFTVQLGYVQEKSGRQRIDQVQSKYKCSLCEGLCYREVDIEDKWANDEKNQGADDT